MVGGEVGIRNYPHMMVPTSLGQRLYFSSCCVPHLGGPRCVRRTDRKHSELNHQVNRSFICSRSSLSLSFLSRSARSSIFAFTATVLHIPTPYQSPPPVSACIFYSMLRRTVAQLSFSSSIHSLTHSFALLCFAFRLSTLFTVYHLLVSNPLQAEQYLLVYFVITLHTYYHTHYQ